MKNITIALGLFIVLTAFTASSAYAQYGQYGQYQGGSPAQFILIDKQVGKAIQTKGGLQDYDYVDNLTTADTRFKPGQIVAFKLRVKNTSAIVLNDVKVRDFLPSYLEPVEGPGEYNAPNRTITVNVGIMNPGEEKTYFMKMQLASQDKMPADKGIFCLTNKAEAATDKTQDDDTAQFCLEKEVTNVTTVPNTGPELGPLLLGGQLLGLGVGIFLRKKAA